MPKQVSQAEFEAVLEIVRQFPDGASLEEIIKAMPTEMPRRTLQRRLTSLLARGRLVKGGRARATRYRMPVVTETLVERLTVSSSVQGERYVPISTEAESIKRHVRQPLGNRQPVAYNRDFLDRYRPNETYYLTEEHRQQLLELGKSPEEARPAGTYARQILNRLLIDLSWNSSRLEGNTYSLLETEQLLEFGESAEGKDAIETQMILNHKAAIELLVEQAGEIGFNRYTILNLHGLLSDNLLGDPKAGGRLRTTMVGIEGTVFQPLAVPQLIDECFNQILDTAAAIADPFEQSFFALVHLPYLQPFIDVNKRVSRLAANIPFIQRDLCPLSFVDVPERANIEGILGVYELNRIELLRDIFIWAYQRSAARYSVIKQSLGEPDPFRLHYRQQIAPLVHDIIQESLGRKLAGRKIKQFAELNLPDEDKARFIEITETELMSLHEGNIARYRIRPSEYLRWREAWGNYHMVKATEPP